MSWVTVVLALWALALWAIAMSVGLVCLLLLLGSMFKR